MAGLRGLWVECRVHGEDVLLDWADVLPSSVVFSALDLNVIASWGQGFVIYCTGNI